jgi:hypothetical protein
VAYEKNDEEPFIPDVADEQKDNTDWSLVSLTEVA